MQTSITLWIIFFCFCCFLKFSYSHGPRHPPQSKHHNHCKTWLSSSCLSSSLYLWPSWVSSLYLNLKNIRHHVIYPFLVSRSIFHMLTFDDACPHKLTFQTYFLGWRCNDEVFWIFLLLQYMLGCLSCVPYWHPTKTQSTIELLIINIFLPMLQMETNQKKR